MACPNENPIWPPLSYSIVSFGKNDFDDPNTLVSKLIECGFSCITIIPMYTAITKENQFTYKSEGKDKHFRDILSIDTSKTPSLDRIKSLMIIAINKGLNVKLEPYLEPDTNAGGENYWRAYLNFDPNAPLPQSSSYFDVVLQPLMNLIVDLKDTPIENFPDCKPCFSFTLGSELEMSVVGYPGSWLDALKKLQTQRTTAQIDKRLNFGHKINFDHAFRARTFLGYLHTLQQKPQPTNDDVKNQGMSEGTYFASLDYLSLSFYPDMSKIPDTDWKEAPSDDKTGKIADEFTNQFDRFFKPFSGLPNLTPEIGEFGLGSTDVSKPWSGDNSGSLNTPEGKNVRLNYYKGFLQFLKKNKDRFKMKKQSCYVFSPSTFWAVGTFDPLIDDDLKKSIKEFNIQNHADEPTKSDAEPNKKDTTPAPKTGDSSKSLKNSWKLIGGMISAGIIIVLIVWYFVY